jgi:hypothetical protein
MGFVHPETRDLLVAFCRDDDRPAGAGGSGWVTSLIGQLTGLVALKMGRRELVEVAKDDAIADGRIAEEDVAQLRDAAVVMVILSRQMLAAPGSKRLLELLEAKNQGSPGGGRVFVVELERVGRPRELGDLRAYRFWVENESGNVKLLGYPIPDPGDKDYYAKLFDLGSDLVEELKRLEAAARPAPAAEQAPPRPGGQPAVYLAETTDDLDEHRDDLRRFLLQHGFDVLPQRLYPREDVESFRAAARADLARAAVFVQLLSAVPGKRLRDSERGLVGLQYDCAVAQGLPVFQWRSPEIDLRSVDRDDHRALLMGPNVTASGLAEFKHEVISHLERRTAEQAVVGPPAETTRGPTVFLNPERSGLDLEKNIWNFLLQREIQVVLPVRTGEPAKVRENLMRMLELCDGLILVPEGSSFSWCNHQLLLARKTSARREHPLTAIAIALDQEVQGDQSVIRLPNMKAIDCRNGVTDLAFGAFLEVLRAGEAR